MESLLTLVFLLSGVHYNPPTLSVRDRLNPILPRQWSTALTPSAGWFAKVRGLGYLLLPGGLLGGGGLENRGKNVPSP